MRARKPATRMITALLLTVLLVYVAVCAVVFFPPAQHDLLSAGV